eukprot:6305196-Alexandrium_andersonii.AAC.1
MEAWDDFPGKKLDPVLVRKARQEEMEEFRRHQVYEKVPIEECRKRTGEAPAQVRWIDIIKGDRESVSYTHLRAHETSAHL